VSEAITGISTERRLFGYLSFQVAGTLVSRLTGFIRELVTAAYFGAGPAADAFIAALTIPNLFRDVLGEDVVERSFMPGIREELARKEHERAWRLASASLNWMLVGLALTVAFIWYFAPWLVDLVAHGIRGREVDEGTIHDVIAMTRVLSPFILFIGLAAFVGGLLYYGYDLHLVFSLAPATLSIGVIAGVVFLTKSAGVYALAWGFVIGAGLQFVVQVPFLWNRRVRASEPRYHMVLKPPTGYSRRMARESGHVTLQSLLTKTTEIVDRRVASFLAPGGISSLWFAMRLVQLPFAIIAIAISRAVTPYLSEMVGTGNRAEFKRVLLVGYRYNLLFILPITGLLIILAHPIVRLVYERGKFGAHDTDMTTLAFWCYAAGLMGMSLFTLGSRVCSALERNRVATLTATVGAALNIWLNYVLSATPLRHGGIALATSIGYSVNALLLFIWLHHHLRQGDSGFRFRELAVPALRVAGNALIAAFGAYGIYRWVIMPSQWLMAGGLIRNAAAVAIPLTIGGVVYVVSSLLNPVEEVRPVIRRVGRLLSAQPK